MYLFALLLLGFSLFLSAVFSGAEIGFYRVPRLRLKLEAMQGRFRAKNLLRLLNYPSLFVATILVGNNVANYLFSFASVLLTQTVIGPSEGPITEILATLCLAPILFVYGEMFPKYLFLHAPNRLLHLTAPFIFISTLLFLPFTIFIWLIDRLLVFVLGQSHERIHLTLARAELEKTFDEGHEIGVLGRAQHQLADNVLAIAHQRVQQYTIPPHKYPYVTTESRTKSVLSLVHTHNLSEIPVYEPTRTRLKSTTTPSKARPKGYVRTIDLELWVRFNRSEQQVRLGKREKELIRELPEISAEYSPLTALKLFYTFDETLGLVVDKTKNVLGFTTPDHLHQPLLQ